MFVFIVAFGLQLHCNFFRFTSFFFFETEFHSCYPGWSAVAPPCLTASSTSRVQAILLNSWDYRLASPCLANFIFLVETGFHYVGQAGLEFLTLGDPPASTSQSAEITGMSHLTRPRILLKGKYYRGDFRVEVQG